MSHVAVVLGTHNRLRSLQNAVESIRRAARGVPYEIVVVDGCSSDGTRDWTAQQKDVLLIGQPPPLTGAVAAFNLGFGYAVDRAVPYVCHMNDDAQILTEGAFARAISRCEADPKIGVVAFAFDLRGGFSFDRVHGKTQSNFGLVRREAGMAVARAQGDPDGKRWWHPDYYTYGADNEFSCWMWKLGWKIDEATDIQVHDLSVKDALRSQNQSRHNGDSERFWRRWPDARSLQP